MIDKRFTRSAHQGPDGVEQAGVTIHSEFCEGDEMKGLLRLAGQLWPDLRTVGLRFEPSGLSQYLGGTPHELALPAGCIYSGSDKKQKEEL